MNLAYCISQHTADFVSFSVNHKSVCSTARATPVLVIIVLGEYIYIYIFYFPDKLICCPWKHGKFDEFNCCNGFHKSLKYFPSHFGTDLKERTEQVLPSKINPKKYGTFP